MQLNHDQTCCDSHQLEAYLSASLDDTVALQVEVHLSSCHTCRERLEQAAFTQEEWERTQSLLRPDDLDSALLELHSEHGHVDRDSCHDESAMLSREIQGWLDPTDDPAMLGRFAGYEVVGIIGHGGMGIVLKGFESSLNRYVAIKILAPRLATNGTARKRFAREARAAAAVLHENVIAIHRVNEWHGLPFLVMPYVAGVSLQKRIDDEGPLSIEATLRVGMQIAAGLAAAHAQGHGNFEITALFGKLSFTPSDDGSGVIALTALLENSGYTHRSVQRGAMMESRRAKRQFVQAEFINTPDGQPRIFWNGTTSEEATSGRLRLARVGETLYCLFAAGDSPEFRLIHTEQVGPESLLFGGIRLAAGVQSNGSTHGTTSVIWRDLTIRAERITDWPARLADPNSDAAVEQKQQQGAPGQTDSSESSEASWESPAVGGNTQKLLQERIEHLQAMERDAEEAPQQSARIELLRRASNEYRQLYQQHRSQAVGLYCHLYEARCLRKLGDNEQATKILLGLRQLSDNAKSWSPLKTMVSKELGSIREEQNLEQDVEPMGTLTPELQ